ncbi:uncharacterized protein LOC131958501 [Physella acuta]|uniref:uncharacterized protein LOC131958501 n=1 Tax=Physella acuta TaxID=109671 RepID=UPI0027DE8EE6|nr:uncharacterized protein LOC131958501 [Physella acuta]
MSNMEQNRMSQVKVSASKTQNGQRHQSSASEGMWQALCEPVSSIRPAPMHCRVRDAGREFLQHNETCQWIQHMVEENVKVVPVLVDNRQASAVVVADVPVVKSSCENLLEASKSPTHEAAMRMLEEQREELMVQQKQLDEKLLKHAEDKKYVQDHEALKQAALAEKVTERKQHHEHEGLKMAEVAQMEWINKSIQVTPTVKLTQSYAPPLANRRRLKGSLAQSCALRDEGTLGSLLWQTKSSFDESQEAERVSAEYKRTNHSQVHANKEIRSNLSMSTLTENAKDHDSHLAYDSSIVPSYCTITNDYDR